MNSVGLNGRKREEIFEEKKSEKVFGLELNIRGKRQKWIALRSRTKKNLEVSTGPHARLFAYSLALSAELIHSLAFSLLSSWDTRTPGNQAVLTHSAIPGTPGCSDS